MTDCGVACGACPLAGLCGDPVPGDVRPYDLARFEVDAQGVTTDRVNTSPTAGPLTRCDTDAPDVDPAEPRPADAGCCGGACAA